MNTKEQFERAWENFEIRLKGKLLKAMEEKREFSLVDANAVLKAVREGFLDDTHMDGRWLAEFARTHAEKAERIRDILGYEMRFNYEVHQAQMSGLVKYGVPIATGILGGGIAVVLQAGILRTVVSIAIPAALSGMIVNSTDKARLGQSQDRGMDEYIGQLATYHKETLQILESI